MNTNDWKLGDDEQQSRIYKAEEDIPCQMEAAAKTEYERTGNRCVALLLVCFCPKCRMRVTC